MSAPLRKIESREDAPRHPATPGPSAGSVVLVLSCGHRLRCKAAKQPRSQARCPECAGRAEFCQEVSRARGVRASNAAVREKGRAVECVRCHARPGRMRWGSLCEPCHVRQEVAGGDVRRAVNQILWKAGAPVIQDGRG